MVQNRFQKPPIGPRHWLSWLAVGMFWMLGRLPPRLGRLLVMPIGPLCYHLMGRRRQIARRNIDKCFPERSSGEREGILKESFHSLARMLVATAWCWAAPLERVAAMTRVDGLENLQNAEELGRGVLILTFHSTCLEMGGFSMEGKIRFSAMYRRLKNPVIEWYQVRGRGRYSGGLIDKKNPRRAFRLLKDGGVLWYAPDQDFGREASEFVPFFGIQTATLSAIHRFPVLTGCAVVPMFPRFDRARNEYVTSFLPALDNFPSADAVADLTRVSAIMEAQIRQVPEQYWWIHRRFKTRPEGEAPFYK